MNAIEILITILSMLAATVVLGILQVFLSKKDKKIFGLLLPISLISLFALISLTLVIFTPEIDITRNVEPNVLLIAEQEMQMVIDAQES